MIIRLKQIANGFIVSTDTYEMHIKSKKKLLKFILKEVDRGGCQFEIDEVRRINPIRLNQHEIPGFGEVRLTGEDEGAKQEAYLKEQQIEAQAHLAEDVAQRAEKELDKGAISEFEDAVNQFSLDTHKHHSDLTIILTNHEYSYEIARHEGVHYMKHHQWGIVKVKFLSFEDNSDYCIEHKPKFAANIRVTKVT